VILKINEPNVDVGHMQLTASGATAALPVAITPTTPTLPQTPFRTEIAAHRGNSGPAAPLENTIDAFRRAMQVGADLVETDVHRTADGVLVLYHDSSIDGRSIAKTKYADLPLLPNGQRMPTLQQLVDLEATAGGKTRLLIETKHHGYEAEVVAMLRSRLQPGQYELMSFDLDSVRALRELAPDSKVGVLFGLMPDWQTGTWPISGAAMVDKARKLGVDFVAIDKWIASDGRIDALAKAGFDVAIWTVDKDADLRRFLGDSRVKRIITDRPDLAIPLRDQRPPAGSIAAERWRELAAA
jgi:glycerophosphoryl diester phosphodiesterase